MSLLGLCVERSQKLFVHDCVYPIVCKCRWMTGNCRSGYVRIAWVDQIESTAANYIWPDLEKKNPVQPYFKLGVIISFVPLLCKSEMTWRRADALFTLRQ